jgi:uncharacterized protein (UPF0548 family)
MFLLRKPSDRKIRSFILAQQQSRFSYEPLGGTKGEPPAGYNVDNNRMLLGSGADAFSAAVAAIKQWKMFDFDWVHLYHDQESVEAGKLVAVVVKHLGFWSLKRLPRRLCNRGRSTIRIRLRNSRGACRTRRGTIHGRVE